MRTFERTLSLGILPMLQFTTAFTYFIHRERRESLGVPPYSLHAIFAHGKEAARKQARPTPPSPRLPPPLPAAAAPRHSSAHSSTPPSPLVLRLPTHAPHPALPPQFIFREEQLWHDPPSYYEGRLLDLTLSLTLTLALTLTLT